MPACASIRSSVISSVSKMLPSSHNLCKIFPWNVTNLGCFLNLNENVLFRASWVVSFSAKLCNNNDLYLHFNCKNEEVVALKCYNHVFLMFVYQCRVLSCLMDNIDSELMDKQCAQKLYELQYFIAKDFT